MHKLQEETNRSRIKGKLARALTVTVIAVSLLLVVNSLTAETADAAGYSTAPPAGQSLLVDHFGVTPQLIPQGGGRYSFDRNSLIPANPGTVGWTEIDWFGTWSFSNWATTTVWGTEPSGGEWYDVEAMYIDNDADNIYAVVVTSCPPYYDWSQEIVGAPAGVGIYEARYSAYPIYKFVLPGDLAIDLGNAPRDEKGATSTSYDLGVDIVHEKRNPKDPFTVGIWGDSRQHSVQAMWDNQVGYQLYQTTADPGGQNIGDPYLDLGTVPKYDWYTANVHEVSEWQHTNFDPSSSWGNLPTAVTGGDEVTVYYYEYIFDPMDPTKRENDAGTFIIEVTIPRNRLASIGADPQPGDTIGIQWVTGCRNEGVKTASASIEIKGTIGDFVWNDVNTNGCQDQGEDGVSGVEVQLFESGGVSPVLTTTTDFNGYYQFSVNPDDYYLKFIKPSGWTFTAQDAGCGGDDKDSDANSAGTTADFTLASAASDLTRDAGMYAQRAQIGDKVWHDLNHNGLQDSGEPGINNVKVELYDSGSILEGTTYTSSSGIYSFTGLEPGDYYLKFYIPTASGYLFTLKDAGGNAVDSDANPSGITVTTTLTPGETDYSWDCGMYKKGKIGDYVWEDKDGDGIQNDGATGISGITVDLYYWGGSFADTTSTSGTGYYHFDVDPGQYYVKFIKGSYDIFTLQNVGGDTLDSDANSAGNTDQITITSGEEELKWDAGLIEYATLGDFVWHDLDGDGVQDAGEPGMDDITVRLYDSGGLQGTTTTNILGEYLFTGLEPGDYYVEFSQPVDYFFSPQDATTDNKDSDADATTGQTGWVNLESGEDDLTVDAGLMMAPETIKVLIGTIYYNEQLVDYLEATNNEFNEIISSDTIIYLNYTNPSILDSTYFRVWRWDETLEDWVLLFDWMTTDEGVSQGFYPIDLCFILNATAEDAFADYYDTTCCDFVYPCCGLYEIEFYSVDIYENVESLKYNDVYIDCEPPVSTKTYGFPNVVEWWSEETVHWITSETTITLTADDGYGSGIEEIWYKIYYPNGTLYTTPNRPDNFTLYTGPVTVDGPDGTYLIYYKALDIIGHVERERKQKFVLDNDSPLGDGSVMYMDPASQTVGQDVSSSVEIYIDTMVLLQGIQFGLTFNPLYIAIDSVDVNLPLYSNGVIDNIAGTVTGIFGAYSSGGMTGETLIATVYFTASASNAGDTPLAFTDVIALDGGGMAVPILVWDGMVTVTGQTSSCPYDLTGNGYVDIDDIDMAASHFGETGYPGVITGDVSGPEGIPDGVVNIFDIIAIANHYGPC